MDSGTLHQLTAFRIQQSPTAIFPTVLGEISGRLMHRRAQNELPADCLVSCSAARPPIGCRTRLLQPCPSFPVRLMGFLPRGKLQPLGFQERETLIVNSGPNPQMELSFWDRRLPSTFALSLGWRDPSGGNSRSFPVEFRMIASIL